MNIIGISGLENAIPFKRGRWPNLDEREYRISQGHDAAAALIAGGRVVGAAAEERFNRQKHSGKFPIDSILACLSIAGLSIEDIDEVAHAFDYAPLQSAFSIDATTARLYEDVFSREALLASVGRHLPGFPANRVVHVNHHLAHAASAYFTSGWDECLVVVVDAMGEADGITIYHGRNGKVEKLNQTSAQDSIGVLYSLVTLHLGFDFNADEYKIMGLAPYGDPERFRSYFDQAVEYCPNGSIRIPLLRMNRDRDEREHYTASRRHLAHYLIPPRHPDGEIVQAHRDAAAALQCCLDRVMLHVCGSFGRKTGLRRLALAGGVGLNCTSNAKLVRSGLFDEIYIQPAAGDDGSALGAALYRAAEAGEVQNVRSPAPFYGPAYSTTDIENALQKVDGKIRAFRYDTLGAACDHAAKLIAEGHVIGWYRGRMEFGPRALGHRSILADPGRHDMRDRINAMVKMREAFRPFAPAVTLEQAHLWFEVPPGAELPYMITTVSVRSECRAALPAITHVDGSARLQTVSAGDNGDFHSLLCAVGRRTGREMVLNTSFNVKGQPIVNTPDEALATFLHTGIEFLFLENVFVEKR